VLADIVSDVKRRARVAKERGKISPADGLSIEEFASILWCQIRFE
jgi:hypothetical protein